MNDSYLLLFFFLYLLFLFCHCYCRWILWLYFNHWHSNLCFLIRETVAVVVTGYHHLAQSFSRSRSFANLMDTLASHKMNPTIQQAHASSLTTTKSLELDPTKPTYDDEDEVCVGTIIYFYFDIFVKISIYAKFNCVCVCGFDWQSRKKIELFSNACQILRIV